MHWVLRKIQQSKRSSLGSGHLNRRGGFAQFSCRRSQRTGAKVQMASPDRASSANSRSSSASPCGPTKPTQASAPSSISPPHPSIRDESQQALGEKALCADLRPYTASQSMTAICVRREKAALSSGCKSNPANAPAGSNRSTYGTIDNLINFTLRAWRTSQSCPRCLTKDIRDS